MGQWHSLSDAKREAALNVRIDFMHFCGIGLSDAVPDESTLCRFLNRLLHAGKLAPLLAAVNAQLQGHGLMVANATGAVIDATLVASAARPKSMTIIEHVTETVSADFTPKRSFADKGFSSRANRAHLHQRAIKSALMHQAQRNKPLSSRQKSTNKRISKTRYIVALCFGTMKRLFGMSRASYIGTKKVNAQFTLKAICLNLLKAANKICLKTESVAAVRPRYAQ